MSRCVALITCRETGKRLIAAERHHFALLDHAQQAGLQHQRHVADFIEKQCAAVGLQNLPDPAFLHRAGERAARIAEQLALDQALRNGGAIDRHEGLVEPQTAVVQGLGERLLAGAGRSLQQYRHLLREQLPAEGQVLAHLRIFADVVLPASPLRALARFGRRIRRRQFQGARGRPQRRARNREETPAMRQVPHRPNRAGLELSAPLQRREIELEEVLDRLADQRLARRAAQLQKCAFIDRSNIAGAVHRNQRFVQQPDEFRPAVKAQDPGLAEFVQEVPAGYEMRRHVDQRHGMALDQPAVAGICRRGIQHRDDGAVRIENRRAGARQGQIVAAEMFLAVHGHRTAFRQAGTDAVGAFVALVPKCAQRQAGLAEFALQGGIGDGGQHHPLGIRQNDGESRAGDLFVQTLHFRPRHGEQLPHPLLQFLQRLGIEHGVLARRRRLDAVFPQTPIPGARDMRLDSGGLQSVLYDMKNSRRVTRSETQVRHDIPRVTALPCSNGCRARCGKPTQRATATAQPPRTERGLFAPIVQSALQHFTAGREELQIYRRGRRHSWSGRRPEFSIDRRHF